MRCAREKHCHRSPCKWNINFFYFFKYTSSFLSLVFVYRTELLPLCHQPQRLLLKPRDDHFPLERTRPCFIVFIGFRTNAFPAELGGERSPTTDTSRFMRWSVFNFFLPLSFFFTLYWDEKHLYFLLSARLKSNVSQYNKLRPNKTEVFFKDRKFYDKITVKFVT